MIIKKGFILREVAGNHIVVAVGKNAMDFNGLITLNDSGVFLWKQLESGSTEDELLRHMLEEYDIDENTAKSDISEFIDKCRSAEVLDEG